MGRYGEVWGDTDDVLVREGEVRGEAGRVPQGGVDVPPVLCAAREVGLWAERRVARLGGGDMGRYGEIWGGMGRYPPPKGDVRARARLVPRDSASRRQEPRAAFNVQGPVRVWVRSGVSVRPPPPL